MSNKQVRQPLDEKDAEIERLREQIRKYERVLNMILVGLSNNDTPESVAVATAFIRKELREARSERGTLLR